MKIVFFGGGDFSLRVLKAIKASKHELVAVVCPPDMPSGRGNKIVISPVKAFALKHNIKVLQYKSVSRYGEADLKALKCDIFISASFGQLFKQNIIDIVPLGIVNVHASLLPKYRGASPIQFCLFNGELETGVTIMQTELGMDTGDIYLQKKLDIEPFDNAQTLFEKLGDLGGAALVEFLDNYKKFKTNKRKQNESLASYTTLIKDDMCRLDFNKSPTEIVNFVRGCCCVSTAYFVLNDAKIKVFVAKAIISPHNFEVGTVTYAHHKGGLQIACNGGFVDIVELQYPGKKRMNIKDFLNGTKIEVGSVVSNI